jgi:hypothetical protein
MQVSKLEVKGNFGVALGYKMLTYSKKNRCRNWEV